MSGSIKEVARFGAHSNAFGFIRLALASLVIVSHTPELIDGNRGREILTRIFHTISFGELAVDGFFIVSGYLIVGSFLSQDGVASYVMKRIVRIYPAFLASTLLCIIVVAPLAGASFSDIWRSSGAALRRMILLYPPEAPNVFSGTPYADLNGAMWTINYEFRCYLLVLILGVTGVLRRPWILLVLTILCIVGFEQTYFHAHDRNLRLLSMFLVGSLFFVWRDRIVFYPMATAAAFAALVKFMFVPVLAEPAVAVFGSYVIFSLASFGGSWPIARINNRDDISYGLYLYAWPIEKLILWYAPSSSPWLVGATTLLGASAFGWLSWHGLEKPILRLSARTHAPLRVEQSFRALLQKLGPGKKLPKSAYEALGDAQ